MGFIMKYDHKNALKLQISTYLEESLSMIGSIMLDDLFDHIENNTDEDAENFVVAHYDENIFELIAPYLQKASEEYEKFKRTPQGEAAMQELKDVMKEAKEMAIKLDKIKNVKPTNEGNGNVH